ncbi:MAG: DNA polymerase III subunit [Clostridia bacterium]|nr:DNA polymerase III subunit [Clostridia bacterium]
MNRFSGIFGNKENIAMFSSLIEAGKLSHAYLFAGAEGSGKKTLAFAVAAALASKTSDENTVRRIIDGYCPDVLLVNPPDDKKTTGVDTVREFISKVALSPEELEFKMYIFNKADRLTPQAQNSLLKVIEEPPADVYIFLLCEEPSSMLKTVRSRVQTVFMERFSPDKIAEFFNLNGGVDTYGDKFDFASRLCRGSIGKVKELAADEKALSLYESVGEIIDLQTQKLRGASYFDFIKKISDLSGSREDFLFLTDYLLLAYRDIIAVKASESEDTIFFTKERATALSDSIAMDSLEISAEAVSKISQGMQFNTNINISSAHLASLLWNAV